MRLNACRLTLTCLSLSLAFACADDGPSSTDDGASETSTSTGDGDGDPTTSGDGDGDPTTSGDGDGDPTTSGDGDGDPTTSGDGDGDDTPSLPPDFLDTLTQIEGCSDVYIAATNVDGTLGLLFNGAELAAIAHELGETQVRESTLPSADVELRVVIGSDLDQGCNDAGPIPAAEYEWTAVSGTVTLTVVPVGMAEPWAVPADATLELSDVSFEGDGLDPVLVEAWMVADVSVGWFPG